VLCCVVLCCVVLCCVVLCCVVLCCVVLYCVVLGCVVRFVVLNFEHSKSTKPERRARALRAPASLQRVQVPMAPAPIHSSRVLITVVAAVQVAVV
jgi:hypothetical protein